MRNLVSKYGKTGIQIWDFWMFKMSDNDGQNFQDSGHVKHSWKTCQRVKIHKNLF